MDNPNIQQAFFKIIKSKLLPHQSLSDEVQELLGLGADSAYRRIRGEKPLSIEEAVKLCNAYHLSMDATFATGTNKTTFEGNFLDATGFDFALYLDDILQNLKSVDAIPEKKIYVDTKDIPPFHYYQFPLLAAFKCYVWMQFMLGYDEHNKISFQHNDVIAPLLTTGKMIAQLYTQIPSVEIWNLESINSTIRQVQFYYESGIIKNKDLALALFDDLSLMVGHIHAQAQAGKKFLYGHHSSDNPQAAYSLFVNGVFLGDNTMMVETPAATQVFVNHSVLNFMKTTDTAFVSHAKKTFDNIMRKSSLISSVNELDRNKFFNTLQQRISNAREGA